VVVSGVVPDEATKAAILERAREVYGAQGVVDQLGVGKLSAPPKWAEHVQRLITPDLKQVTQGELRIRGTTIELTGKVDSPALQTQIPAQLTNSLGNPTYLVRNGLRVGGAGQAQLDAALANRIVEFAPGKDTLTPNGVQILEELLPVLQQFSGRRFEVIGHTDSDGPRASNVALSQARAAAVKAYLVERGIPATSVTASGAGPDSPVADNSTPEGRARNRRIEFRVLA
jgi:OmpA-OmpF porin, OOP family